MLSLLNFSIIIVLIATSCQKPREQEIIAADTGANAEILQPENTISVKSQLPKPVPYAHWFDLSENGKQQYTEEYKKLLETESTYIRLPEELKDIPRMWLRIELDSGKFYFLHSCEFTERFAITDSTVIRYYQDGEWPELILNAQRDGDGYDIRTSNTHFKLKLISKDSAIYRTSEDWKSYFIPLEAFETFPKADEDCGDR